MIKGLIVFFIAVEKLGWEEAVLVSFGVFLLILVGERICARWKK